MAKLLIIDDDRAYREYLERVLSQAGHEVVCLSNGLGLRTAVGKQPFDAVLTALYMPECDGLETIATLRGLTPAIPVIGMAANAGGAEDPCSHAMRLLGAVAVIDKPIDRDALLALLDGVLADGAAVRTGSRRRLPEPVPLRVA